MVGGTLMKLESSKRATAQYIGPKYRYHDNLEGAAMDILGVGLCCATWFF